MRAIERTLASALVAGAALFGCASPPQTQRPAATLTPTPPPTFKVAQLKFEPNAPFEICPETQCPKVTPKTLHEPLRPTSGAAPAASEKPEAALANRQINLGFAPGSAALTPAARRALAAALPEARRATVIEIRGRTDDVGRQEQNDEVAFNRAIAVRDYLHRLKLSPNTNIRFSSKGSCCYIESNDTSSGRTANRRVEVEFYRPLQLAQGKSE